MTFEYTTLQVISEFLDLKDLKSLAHVDKSTRIAVSEYVKYNRVINCERDKEKALKLVKEGYKVKLDLSDCDNITDLSALDGVHTLDLSCCYGITDLSALGGVHTLIV